MRLSTGKSLNLSAAGFPQGHPGGPAETWVSRCPVYHSSRPVPWGQCETTSPGRLISLRSLHFCLPTKFPDVVNKGVCSFCWRAEMGHQEIEVKCGDVICLGWHNATWGRECQEMRSLWEADLIRFGFRLHWWQAECSDSGNVRATVTFLSLLDPCPSTWVWIWHPKQWTTKGRS